MKHVLCLSILLVSISGCGPEPVTPKTPTPPQTSLAVAAAADLKYAFDEVVDEFKRQHPSIQVEMTYGASGNLFAQLSNKAPFDIYLSADIGYPRKLIEQGDAVKESEFQYAVGHIVVWVRNNSPLDIGQRGIAVLNDPAVQKIAIANPRHAPYGRAAEAALKHLEVYESVKDRLVLGENVAQATQFVDSGAADVGIIALSLAMAPPMREKGRFWALPSDSYPTLEQGGVILSWAKDREACDKLRAFVMSEPGRAILLRYGFDRPEK